MKRRWQRRSEHANVVFHCALLLAAYRTHRVVDAATAAANVCDCEWIDCIQTVDQNHVHSDIIQLTVTEPVLGIASRHSNCSQYVFPLCEAYFIREEENIGAF